MEDSNRISFAWASVAGLQVAGITALGIFFAIHWSPVPYSDWLLYWRSAGDPGAYERGGIGLWLLAIPKVFGAPAHIAALALNLPAAIWLCVLAYRADRTRFRLFAQLIIAYLLLITPYFGIVQLDLIGAAFLATGFCLLLKDVAERWFSWRILFAGVAVAVAVSTRPQYALVLWAMLVLWTIGWAAGSQWRDRRSVLIYVVLLAGSVAGFCVDMGLRQISGQTEQIRTSSAVTVYAGLLTSADTAAERCGQWTPEAAGAARADLQLPLANAIVLRLSAHPPAHWLGVLRCKAPQIVSPPAYALYWLMESPNVVAKRVTAAGGSKSEANYARARRIESWGIRLLGFVVLAVCVWVSVRGMRTRGLRLALLPLVWIGAFWLVHAVFEIQGRYFLGLYVIAPLLCALVWLGRDGKEPGRERAS